MVEKDCSEREMSEIEIISRKEAVSQGLKRYFTGKECPKGHIARRNVCDRGCVQCTADRRAKLDRTEYNLENKDKLREIAYAWRRRNPEKAKEASRRCSQNRRNNHGDLVRAAQREYYKNNSEKMRDRNKEYRKNSPMVECECGSKVKEFNLTKHKRTKRHQNYENSLHS